MMERLPVEMILEICEYLPASTLCKLQQTSRRYRAIIQRYDMVEKKILRYDEKDGYFDMTEGVRSLSKRRPLITTVICKPHAKSNTISLGCIEFWLKSLKLLNSICEMYTVSDVRPVDYKNADDRVIAYGGLNAGHSDTVQDMKLYWNPREIQKMFVVPISSSLGYNTFNIRNGNRMKFPKSEKNKGLKIWFDDEPEFTDQSLKILPLYADLVEPSYCCERRCFAIKSRDYQNECKKCYGYMCCECECETYRRKQEFLLIRKPDTKTWREVGKSNLGL